MHERVLVQAFRSVTSYRIGDSVSVSDPLAAIAAVASCQIAYSAPVRDRLAVSRGLASVRAQGRDCNRFVLRDDGNKSEGCYCYEPRRQRDDNLLTRTTHASPPASAEPALEKYLSDTF
jgi:hypothetical protein